MNTINSLIESIDSDNWFDIIPVIADALEEECYLACSRTCRFICSRRVKPIIEPDIVQEYHSMEFKGFSGDSLPTDQSHRFNRTICFSLIDSFKTSLALCCIDVEHQFEKSLKSLPFVHPHLIMGKGRKFFYSVFPEPGEDALRVVLSWLTGINPHKSRNAGTWGRYNY